MSNAPTIRLFADAHVFDGPYQGTRTFLLGLYTELARQDGIEVYLGAQDCAGLRRSFAPVADRIRFIPYRSRSRYGRLLRELPALLEEHRIDYAHFQYAAPLRKVCAYIVTTHDLLFEELKSSFHFVYRHLRRRWFRHSALQADLLTSVSGYAARSIARHYRLPQQQISVVPNAVPALPVTKEQQQAARRRLRARYGVDKYLLCVSRVEPRKNQQLLVDAFRSLRLADAGYQLVLIGARSLSAPALNAALAELPARVREAIWLLEDIPADELQDWYLGTQLFLYPSLGEGFGIPPLEAAAAQVPVLCSNRTALADFDFFGPDHVDPQDSAAFRKRIAELLRQPPATDVLEWRAAQVAARYSWQHSAQLFLHGIRAHRAQSVAL